MFLQCTWLQNVLPQIQIRSAGAVSIVAGALEEGIEYPVPDKNFPFNSQVGGHHL